MKYNITQDALTIFWHNDSMKELSGIPVIACWYNLTPKNFNLLAEELSVYFEVQILFPSGEEKPFDYEGHGKWIQVRFDFKIKKWPNEKKWSEIIRLLFDAIMKYKPVVVYATVDEFYDDPPNIFSKDVIGYIWAALTDNGKFYMHSPLMEEFSPLQEMEIEELNSFFLSKVQSQK